MVRARRPRTATVKLPCGGITAIRSPGFRLLRRPVGEDAAGDALDGDHQIVVRGRGAERIIAPHLLAADHRHQGQMLAGLEPECVGKLGRDMEADRHRLFGFGNDFGNFERVKMLGHYQTASG